MQHHLIKILLNGMFLQLLLQQAALREFSQGHPHLVIVLKNGVSQTLTLRLTIFLQEVN